MNLKRKSVKRAATPDVAFMFNRLNNEYFLEYVRVIQTI